MNSEDFEKWYAERKADLRDAKIKGYYKLEDNEEWVHLGYGYYAREKKKKK